MKKSTNSLETPNKNSKQHFILLQYFPYVYIMYLSVCILYSQWLIHETMSWLQNFNTFFL